MKYKLLAILSPILIIGCSTTAENIEDFQFWRIGDMESMSQSEKDCIIGELHNYKLEHKIKSISFVGGALILNPIQQICYQYRVNNTKYFRPGSPEWEKNIEEERAQKINMELIEARAREAEEIEIQNLAHQERIKQQEAIRVKDEIIAKQEKLQAEKEAKREAWLRSPEGQNFQKNEAKIEKEKQEIFLKNFPYYMIITCGTNYRKYDHLAVHHCFENTNLELNNGTSYDLYTQNNLVNSNIGAETLNGLRIPLRDKFSFTAQNGKSDLILGIRVYNSKSNSLIFEKMVSNYGVIRAGN